jgi:hypothetical protein
MEAKIMKSACAWFLCALLVLLMPGCRSTADYPPAYSALESSPAGQVVLAGLKRHGYPEWSGEGALLFKLRTRERAGPSQSISEEVYSCDTKHHRIHSKGHRGAASVQKTFCEGRYLETEKGREEREPKSLLKGRRRLLDDYFFTILPFFVADQPPARMESLGQEKIKLATYGVVEPLDKDEIKPVKYDVIEVVWEEVGPLPAEKRYRLYYTHSTHRLEKVFYQSQAVDREGMYVWMDCDNFALIDGMLLPLHRTFTLARDEKGQKTGLPFREQWIHEARFESGVDEELFGER